MARIVVPAYPCWTNIRRAASRILRRVSARSRSRRSKLGLDRAFITVLDIITALCFVKRRRTTHLFGRCRSARRRPILRTTWAGADARPPDGGNLEHSAAVPFDRARRCRTVGRPSRRRDPRPAAHSGERRALATGRGRRHESHDQPRREYLGDAARWSNGPTAPRRARPDHGPRGLEARRTAPAGRESPTRHASQGRRAGDRARPPGAESHGELGCGEPRGWAVAYVAGGRDRHAAAAGPGYL